MKVGMIELPVPQSRDGTFKPQVSQRYRRSEKALVSIMVKMYVNGTSTRKVGKLAEQLCGRRFSATTISATLDDALAAFAARRLQAAAAAGRQFRQINRVITEISNGLPSVCAVKCKYTNLLLLSTKHVVDLGASRT